MANTLVSPGVAISVTDESQYGPAGQGTVPLIILATASNKDNVSGTGFAAGTVPANAAKPYLLTSQRELVEFFGKPKFKVVDGTPVHADETNEYGLLAAYSYLGLANRAYVLRADIDLAQLEPTNIEPAGAPANGTVWFDTAATSFGIFESNSSGQWQSKTPIVVESMDQTVSGIGVLPLNSLGNNGDYAVVVTPVVANYQVYRKVAGAWVLVVDDEDSRVFTAPHYQIPESNVAGEVWIKTTTPNNGLNIVLKRYNSTSRQWSTITAPVHSDNAAATAAYAAGLSAGKIFAQVTSGIANIQFKIYDGANWVALNEESGSIAPVGVTPDGTLWYNTELLVDLYVKENGQWEPVYGLVTIDATAPDSPAAGEFWIDSSDTENYPRIFAYDGATWVERDVKDQTTPNGVIFADLTSIAGDTTNGEGGATPVDAETPDPLLFPDGMLLWNSMVSTGNVKQYDSVTGMWNTFSGNQEDGSPYMFRKAQRKAVVRALQSAVNENTQIREEMTFFTLIAAPAYPELLDEMISLNVDRKETAFVIADTPFRLAPQAQTLLNWMSGNNTVVNGEDGIVTTNSQAACYYPSAITSDLDGNDVVVPPSHIVLRTYAYNDQVAYPWFPPAGLTRGVVTNATNVGYVNAEGEFIPVALTNGQRDVLYGDGSRMGINPIARFPGQGLFVFGQRTMQPFASALDRINVARLIAYLRERFDPLARPFIFEVNDTITRANAKQVFDGFLADLLSKRALYDYIVVCDESNNTPARIDRNELYIDIAIEPIKAVEFIYIPIRVVNTGELSA